jgi:gliding motility-associated lipoprotein GldH
MRRTLLIFTFGVFLLSCNRNKVFEEFITLPESWNNSNVLHFNVNITDTTAAQNVLISLRYTGKYEFSNLYLFVTAQSPNGNTMRDTVEVVLADAHGKWLGKGAASIFTQYWPYKTNIRFPLPGIYTFTVEQAMWINDLKNINDVGLRIEKAGGSR